MTEKQNTLIVIKIKYKPGNAIEVNDEYSKYSSDEEEVLFSCYTKFKVIKKAQNYNFQNKKTLDFYIELQHVNDKLFLTD